MKKIISLLLIAVTLIALCGCSNDISKNAVFSPDDLTGKTVGIPNNTSTHCYLANFDELGAIVEVYSSSDSVVNDVASGRLDCAIMNRELAEDEISVFSKVKILDKAVISDELAIITALESAPLLSVIDSTLAGLIKDGTVKKIINNYVNDKEYSYTSPENIQYSGSIKLAVNNIGKPFAYYDDNGELSGMDIDIAKAICDKIGVELQIIDAEGNNLYDFVRSGKADFALGCLSKNKDTQDLVGFTQSYYTCEQVIIVRKK